MWSVTFRSSYYYFFVWNLVLSLTLETYEILYLCVTTREHPLVITQCIWSLWVLYKTLAFIHHIGIKIVWNVSHFIWKHKTQKSSSVKPNASKSNTKFQHSHLRHDINFIGTWPFLNTKGNESLSKNWKKLIIYVSSNPWGRIKAWGSRHKALYCTENPLDSKTYTCYKRWRRMVVVRICS